MRDRYLDQAHGGKVSDLPTEPRERPSSGKEKSVGYKRLEKTPWGSFQRGFLPSRSAKVSMLPKGHADNRLLPWNLPWETTFLIKSKTFKWSEVLLTLFHGYWYFK